MIEIWKNFFWKISKFFVDLNNYNFDSNKTTKRQTKGDPTKCSIVCDSDWKFNLFQNSIKKKKNCNWNWNWKQHNTNKQKIQLICETELFIYKRKCEKRSSNAKNQREECLFVCWKKRRKRREKNSSKDHVLIILVVKKRKERNLCVLFWKKILFTKKLWRKARLIVFLFGCFLSLSSLLWLQIRLDVKVNEQNNQRKNIRASEKNWGGRLHFVC